MLLSMILPVFNSEPWLARCLDSILAAGVTNCEIILVDDGSSDGSHIIEDDYARRYPFVHVIRQSNCGPSSARNTGLRQCSGNYVAFFDSDDYLLSSAFAKTVSLLPTSDADFWVSDFYRVADNSSILDRVCQIEDHDYPSFDAEALEHFLNSGDCVWNIWRCLFNRHFLLENHLFFREGYHCGEDLEFMVRALTTAKKIAFYHNPYYCYRVNYGNTLTRRYTAERVRQLMTMLQSAVRHLNGDSRSVAVSIRRMLAREYFLNLSLYADCPRSERREALHHLQNAQNILALNDRGIYRLSARFASCFGIPVTAWLLLGMKRLRRVRRQILQRRHEP